MRANESRKSTGSSRTEARLAVNLPVALHRTLKQRAAESGVSIRALIIELLARAGIK